MAVLVTGAAGFIGSHLTERLLESGEEVVGFDGFDAFYDPAIKEANLALARAHPGYREIRGDIRDPGKLDAIPGQVDTVVHLAARAGVRPSIQHPQLYTDVNVMGTANLLQWSVERGVETFVFASSSSVYGNSPTVPFREEDRVDQPISPYAATKKAGELLCHTYTHLHGLTTLCLRLFTVYGPRQRPDLAIHKFARLMSEGRPIPLFGDGSSQRDYTYIDDILQGLVGGLQWARENGGSHRVVNLGESRSVRLSEMVEVLAEELGVEPRIDWQPMQPGDVIRTYADISRARELFRYEPTTDFRAGIRSFVEWYREQPTPVRSGS